MGQVTREIYQTGGRNIQLNQLWLDGYRLGPTFLTDSHIMPYPGLYGLSKNLGKTNQQVNLVGQFWAIPMYILSIYEPINDCIPIVLWISWWVQFPSCRACSTSSAFLFAMERDTRRRKRAKMDVKDIGTYWTIITPHNYGSGCTTCVCVTHDWGNS